MTLNQHTIATVRELLVLAEEFTPHRLTGGARRPTRLTSTPRSRPADPGWFIDMLGFNAAGLARHLPSSAPPSNT